MAQTIKNHFSVPKRKQRHWNFMQMKSILHVHFVTDRRYASTV